MREKRDRNGLTLSEFLASYDPGRYERPSVTADVCVFTLVENEGLELAVMLIKRGGHPFIGTYALPGGFVNMDEDIDAAAARELMEETGVSGLSLRQIGAFGSVERDPRTRVITCAYYAVAPLGTIAPKAGDDADDAALFMVETALEAGSASAETFRMMLFGPRMLCERAQLRYDMLGSVPSALPGGDLATDHGLILFSALCALDAQPRKRLARLLVMGNPKREVEAVMALDRALGAIGGKD